MTELYQRLPELLFYILRQYLELHQVLDDFLLKEGGLDFNAMRESLNALLELWEELGNFLTGGAGNPGKIKKKVYQQFKATKKAAPMLSLAKESVLDMIKDTDKIWVLRKDGRLKIYQLGTGREETIPIYSGEKSWRQN